MSYVTVRGSSHRSRNADAVKVLYKKQADGALLSYPFVANRQVECPGTVILRGKRPSLACFLKMLVCCRFSTIVRLSIEDNIGWSMASNLVAEGIVERIKDLRHRHVWFAVCFDGLWRNRTDGYLCTSAILDSYQIGDDESCYLGRG